MYQMKHDFVVFSELFKEPLKNGLNRPTKDRGSGYKMVNMGEIFANDRIFNIDMELVEVSEKERHYFLEKGDLLFARQSLVLSGAGKCSIFMGAPELITFEGHIIRARLNQAVCEPMFYYYYFNSYNGRKNVESIVEQVSAAGIRGSDLSNLMVPYPPLETQKEIAHILGTLDDKIELNRKMNKTLEEIAQTLFKHWFIDFEFSNAEGKPYKSSGGEMIDSELGLIPKGWRVGKAKDIISAIGGYAFKSENMCDNGDIGVIKIKNINNGVVNILDTEYLNDFDYNSLDIRFKVQAGDILIAMTGANVAKVGIVPITTKRLVLNQRVGIIRENTIGTIYYAYMIYKSDEAQQFLYSVGSTGSAQPNISSADIESLGIIIPSCEILALFSKVSINTYKMICKTLYQNEVLDNHKKLVMLEIFEARQYGN